MSVGQLARNNPLRRNIGRAQQFAEDFLSRTRQTASKGFEAASDLLGNPIVQGVGKVAATTALGVGGVAGATAAYNAITNPKGSENQQAFQNVFDETRQKYLKEGMQDTTLAQLKKINDLAKQNNISINTRGLNLNTTGGMGSNLASATSQANVLLNKAAGISPGQSSYQDVGNTYGEIDKMKGQVDDMTLQELKNQVALNKVKLDDYRQSLAADRENAFLAQPLFSLSRFRDRLDKVGEEKVQMLMAAAQGLQAFR